MWVLVDGLEDCCRFWVIGGMFVEMVIVFGEFVVIVVEGKM